MKKIILCAILLASFAQAQLIKKTSDVRRIENNTKVVVATSYCLKGSRMANGVYPREGYIAADPRIYPLGTKLLINGKSYIVGDTGGAIKGLRIDIYISNCSIAKRFGRKKMVVQVI